MPVSGARFFNNCVTASRPPAEAPIATTGNGCLVALSDLTTEVFRFEPGVPAWAKGGAVPSALDWSGGVVFMVLGRGLGLRAGFMV